MKFILFLLAVRCLPLLPLSHVRIRCSSLFGIEPNPVPLERLRLAGHGCKRYVIFGENSLVLDQDLFIPFDSIPSDSIQDMPISNTFISGLTKYPFPVYIPLTKTTEQVIKSEL